MRFKHFPAALGLFGLILLPPARPQTDTIKVESAEVLVDAIVTDRHNRIVPNLSADDFTISEDGVPQKISSFRVHKGAPAESSHQTVPPQEAGSAPPLRQLPDPPALTIFLLDYSTTEYQNQKLV